MLKIIRKIKFSLVHIFSIILFVIGSYLISNSIVRANFFGDVFYSNPPTEELKGIASSYQNNFTNYNDFSSIFSRK